MKSILFLADGMADEPLAELNGKTPLEYANTPAMDSIARKGASGFFRTLPDGLPTSSDVANMSVMGMLPEKNYPGRGPIEAVSQKIELGPDDVAWRCNIITCSDEGEILDYSAGHIDNEVSSQIIADLQKEFGSDKVTFYPGVSYRNLLVLHGKEFSKNVDYAKPDSSHGMNEKDIQLKPLSKDAEYTVEFLLDLYEKARVFLEKHPLNQGKASPANRIWPWSPGYKPAFPLFADKYGRKGAVISAVDVIKGIGICSKMQVIEVEGATGFIDTNYENKADAAVEALKDNDFVYVHVEGIDEVSHLGDLKLKLQAIEEFDARLVSRVMKKLEGQDVRFMILPDHPVPVLKRLHTTDPVPFAVCGPGIEADEVEVYSESAAVDGRIGLLERDDLMYLLFKD